MEIIRHCVLPSSFGRSGQAMPLTNSYLALACGIPQNYFVLLGLQFIAVDRHYESLRSFVPAPTFNILTLQLLPYERGENSQSHIARGSRSEVVHGVEKLQRF
jgi:hypothetical protein